MMSEEKQIEEMAEALETAKVNALATIGSMNDGFGAWYARELYRAGCRKVILCKDCVHCDRCYPVKASGKKAVEAWHCNFLRKYVIPEGFCVFAQEKAVTTSEEQVLEPWMEAVAEIREGDRL